MFQSEQNANEKICDENHYCCNEIIMSLPPKMIAILQKIYLES